MTAGFVLLAGSANADDIANRMISLDVEENADAPGAFSLTLPLSAVEGELDWVGDPRLGPLAQIAVVACGEGGNDECVFDGYVLAHSANVTPGAVGSNLRVWGQDASWLMNMTEKAREWIDASDANVASSIFDEYGISADPGNFDDDSSMHQEKLNTLMQRGTDARFLMELAGRSGKLFRVTNTSEPGKRTGIFARPKTDGSPVASLIVTDTAAANVRDVEISWDVMRPSSVEAGRVLLTSSDPAETREEEGLALLSERNLADFAGQPSTALLRTTADDADDLAQRARGFLVNHGFFVRVTGVADMERLGVVLRVGALVSLETVGSLYSGLYLVWSVRHAMTPDHHEMRFELVSNAIGSSADGGSGGLLGNAGL